MMLHKRTTPLLQSVTDCVVKKHAHYLGFSSDKQIFTLVSFEHQLMTVRMLVSKQNIFTNENLLTHSVLLRSIQPEHIPCFNKSKQEITHYDCFNLKRESLYIK